MPHRGLSSAATAAAATATDAASGRGTALISPAARRRARTSTRCRRPLGDSHNTDSFGVARSRRGNRWDRRRAARERWAEACCRRLCRRSRRCDASHRSTCSSRVEGKGCSRTAWRPPRPLTHPADPPSRRHRSNLPRRRRCRPSRCRPSHHCRKRRPSRRGPHPLGSRRRSPRCRPSPCNRRTRTPRRSEPRSSSSARRRASALV